MKLLDHIFEVKHISVGIKEFNMPCNSLLSLSLSHGVNTQLEKAVLEGVKSLELV